MRLRRCTDCNKHDIVQFKLGRAGLNKIRKFVAAGGFLFTEDWGLEEVIEPIFKKRVRRGVYLKEGSVVVNPAPVKADRAWKRARSRDSPVRVRATVAMRTTSSETTSTTISEATAITRKVSTPGVKAS